MMNKSDFIYLSAKLGREKALGIYLCARMLGMSGVPDAGGDLVEALDTVLNGDTSLDGGRWSFPDGRTFYMVPPTPKPLPDMPHPGDIVEHCERQTLFRVLRVAGTWIHMCDLEARQLLKVNGRGSLQLSVESVGYSLNRVCTPPGPPCNSLTALAARGTDGAGGGLVLPNANTNGGSPTSSLGSFSSGGWVSSDGECEAGDWDTDCVWRSGPPDPWGGWNGPWQPKSPGPAGSYPRDGLLECDLLNKECIRFFSVELGRERALGIYLCARVSLTPGLTASGHDLEKALDRALEGETPEGRWLLPNGRSFTLEPPFRRTEVPSLRLGDIVEHGRSMVLWRVLKVTGSWIHMCMVGGEIPLSVKGKDSLHLSGDSVRHSLGLPPLAGEETTRYLEASYLSSLGELPPPPQPTSGRGRGQ